MKYVAIFACLVTAPVLLAQSAARARTEIPPSTLTLEHSDAVPKFSRDEAINRARKFTGFEKEAAQARFGLATDPTIPFAQVSKRPAWEVTFTGVVFLCKGPEGTRQQNPHLKTVTALLDAETGVLLQVHSLFNADILLSTPNGLVRLSSPDPSIWGLRLSTKKKIEQMPTGRETFKSTTNLPALSFLRALASANCPTPMTKEIAAYFGLYTDTRIQENKIIEQPYWFIIYDGVTMIPMGPPPGPQWPHPVPGERTVTVDATTGVTFWSGQCGSPASAVVLASSLRRAPDVSPGTLHEFTDWVLTDLDPGAIHAYLYNTLTTPLGAEGFRVNDLPVEKYPEIFDWVQVAPNPIPSGMVGEVRIKLRLPLAAPLILQGSGSNGTGIYARIPRQMPPARITFIAFSEDLQKVYVYCTNQSMTDLDLNDLVVFPINNKVDTLAYLPGSRLRPGETACLIATMKQPLTPGQFVWCGVQTGDHALAACALARAYCHFPIQAFDDDHRPEMSFDQENFEMPYPPADDLWATTRKLSPSRAYLLMSDKVFPPFPAPTKADANALEIVRRAQTCWTQDPGHPTLLKVYGAGMCSGFFTYGELADLVAINSWPIFLDGASLWRSADEVTIARRASEPRPVFVIPEALSVSVYPDHGSRRYPAPEEERLEVYMQIAHGSKGVWYYRRAKEENGYEGSPDLQHEIGRINAELAALRPYLSISEPVDWISGKTPGVEAHVLLCGDRGLVVIAINTNFTNWPRRLDNPDKPGAPPFTYTPAADVPIALDLPDTIKVTKVQTVHQGKTEEIAFIRANGRLTFRLPRLDLATPVVLIP